MITYDERTNIIVVTGGTAETPIIMDDIFTESYDNGWGVVDSPTDGEFYLTARLQIGDGVERTYFASSDNNIHFDIKAFEVKSKAMVILQKE